MNTINKTLLLLIWPALLCMACRTNLYKNAAADLIKITAEPTINPVFERMDVNPYFRLVIDMPAGSGELSLRQLTGKMNAVAAEEVDKIELYASDEKGELAIGNRIGGTIAQSAKFHIPLNLTLQPGTHNLWLSVSLKDGKNTQRPIEIATTVLKDSKDNSYKIATGQAVKKYTGIAVRKAMDENVHTYRIPGMITTDKGTLITVYDIRYDNSRDLPANIDVGMSRSTDQGKTWDAMRNIMDMEGPNDNSGVGDPSVLFDPATKTIWVSALWSKGNRSIAGSGPGLTPEETGQFVVTYSKDDGLTWAKPYSITPQVKNPEWRLFFPGPGNGIVMSDGKLVFPAQYWDAQKMPHSTLIYSEDKGKSWKSGLGAKSNTTEAQLVETVPGVLMLNMRDNRGKFRSVATTTDMGQSWTAHPTSYNTLTDPVCMASFIKARVRVKGEMKEVLFFSNQNHPSSRQDFSIKASLDMGETWLPANQLLVDTRQSFGYSALTKVDDDHIGVLYEGIRSLLFVKIPVKDIIK